MSNIFESLNNTANKATDIGEKYLKDTQEYYQLKIFQQLTISISMVAKALVIGGVLFIGLIFLAFAGAIALGDWLDNPSLGYLIVSVVFMLITLLIYVKRAIIQRRIILQMSSKFFNS